MPGRGKKGRWEPRSGLFLQTGMDPQKVLLAKQKSLKKQEKGRTMPKQQRKSLFMKTKVN